MQETRKLSRTKDPTTEGKEDQRQQDKDDKSVQDCSKDGIIAQQRQRTIESAKNQIEQTELDNDEAPERKKVCNAGKGITQYATLTEDDQEKIAEPVINTVSAVLCSSFRQ